MAGNANQTSSARTDGRDWLVEAEEPFASLQLRNGGEVPGLIVAPALLELVRKARHYGFKLAQPISTRDHDETVSAWVEVLPDGDGCVLSFSNWQVAPLREDDFTRERARQIAMAHQFAELFARLGPQQEVLSVECDCPELAPLLAKMRASAGMPWTDFVEIPANSHRQPAHWRLLDGADIRLDGSDRDWTALLVPLGKPLAGSGGFELYLTAKQPLPVDSAPPTARTKAVVRKTRTPGIGLEIAPVLRQPVSRIIANAETIRTQLAGPLAQEYANYAADIAAAGEHLLALIEDLTTLEMVEDEEFDPAPDQIDLADVARRAAGILGVRARESGITVDAPKPGESAPAIGEFRRVLQIVLNLLGNAIRYSPDGSQIWLRVETDGVRSRVIVADQGEGLSEEEQTRVFAKFERLGRSGDGGSGLGLYISYRLADAMHGALSVESAKGQGARFTLELPADLEG